MNELQIFNNPEFGKVRTIVINGEPWLVGRDVAQALGYKNTKDALSTHVDNADKRIIQRSEIATIENHLPKTAFPFDFVNGEIPNRGLTIINESGVYSLIFSSKLPKAKEFKRWVTSEVLPAIRKQGAYLNTAATAHLAAAVREAVAGELREIKDRVTALEDAVTAPFAFPVSALPSPPPKDAEPAAQPPGRDYMKRWMRTASDKLNLMSSKFSMSNNAILSQLYRFLEEEFGVVLADERIRIMEEYNLDDCSTLKAIFYDEDFRDYLEGAIDYNLAPENRGW